MTYKEVQIEVNKIPLLDYFHNFGGVLVPKTYTRVPCLRTANSEDSPFKPWRSPDKGADVDGV